jgi:REP element-mobilizing transposase RayT
VTICSFRRKLIFGTVENGVVVLSELGKIVVHEWEQSEAIRSEIFLDSWVLMPNHLHGIVWITSPSLGVGATGRSPLRKKEKVSGPGKRSLGAFMAGFKAATTSEARNTLRSMPLPIWQRNYYDHIIRNDLDLERYHTYILENPLRWELDEYYPSR